MSCTAWCASKRDMHHIGSASMHDGQGRAQGSNVKQREGEEMAICRRQAHAGHGLQIGHQEVRMRQHRTARDNVHRGGRDHGKRIVRCHRGRRQRPRGLIERLKSYESRRLCGAKRIPMGDVGSRLRPIGHQGQSGRIDEEQPRGSPFDDTADLCQR